MNTLGHRHRRGFTLVELLVVIAIIGILIGLLLPAINSAREAARNMTCKSNLRQVALAILNFESGARRYPASWRPIPPFDAAVTNNGWSAQAQILPFLEEGHLYEDIDFNKPYSDPANVIAIGADTMPIGGYRVSTYLCASEINDEPRFSGAGVRENYPINYAVNLGVWFIWDASTGEIGDGAFAPNHPMGHRSFQDGLSQTLCLAEVKGWTPYMRDKNDDAPAEPSTAADVVALGFGQFKTNSGHTEWVDGRAHQIGFTTTFTPNFKVTYDDGSADYDIDWTNHREGKAPSKPTYAAVTARSYHPGGINVAMMDGGVHWVANDIDLAAWRALSTRDGNDKADSADFFIEK